MPNLKYPITARGKTQSIWRWEIETGIPYSTLKRRRQNGWSHEEIISLMPYERAHKDRVCQIRITIEGATLTIPEWSFATGIPSGTIRSRLKRGYTGLELIDRNKGNRGRRIGSVSLVFDYQDKMYTIPELVKLTGMCYSTLYNRLQRGWSVEDVIRCPITPAPECPKGRVHV